MMSPTNRVTYVEVIARVLILTSGLGTVASAWTATVGTHTSAMVVKVIIYVSTIYHLLSKLECITNKL